jgi:hypothetical protein
LLTVDDGEVKASMETKKPDIKRREASTIPRGSRRVIHTCTLQQQPMACIKMRVGFGLGVPALDHRFFTGFSLAGHRQLHVH